MAIPLFLAMTQTELRYSTTVPSQVAWMACHFSPYGTGLTDLPERLPKGSVLILDDRISEHGHDPGLITEQLRDTVTRLGCTGIVLDLQNEPTRTTRAMAKRSAEVLPCPVAVPPAYAEGIDCPVFLPPVPPHILPEDWLSPWTGREIWLEAALETVALTVSNDGCHCTPQPKCELPFPHHDTGLHCHYSIHRQDEDLRFTLKRTLQDLHDLLGSVSPFGVTTAIGLYQELSDAATQP